VLLVPAQHQKLCMEPQTCVSDFQGFGVKPANQTKKAVSQGKA